MPTAHTIISGGQTGADQGALHAAMTLGLKTGGVVPKGWRTERGPAPWLGQLGLEEHASGSYRPRTFDNVMHSDGTLIFGNVESPGCRCTRRWLEDNNIGILNVAGSRASRQIGIAGAVSAFLCVGIRPLPLDGGEVP